jgi:NADPH:quinone reductase-like Zn-dependent oxidoreductase
MHPRVMQEGGALRIHYKILSLEIVMKAVQFSEYGGPEVLQVVHVDEPHAGPGQVRIAVRAAGVNPSDWKLRAGLSEGIGSTPLPSGLGFEGAGVVDEVGEGVTDVSIGDAVFGFGINVVAQYAVLTNWARKPGGLPFEEAAGFPVAVETATRILAQVGVKSGETLLVSGAAGGVGSAVIQFARYRGITVIGTASAPKHDYLRGLGAIPTTYGPGLVERVRKLAPNGVNAALDLAGSGIIPELVELVGDPSRVLSIADFTAPQHGAQVSFEVQKNPDRALAEAARLYSEGAFRLTVEKTFSLAQTAEAHKLSAAGHVTGKLVITIS